MQQVNKRFALSLCALCLTVGAYANAPIVAMNQSATPARTNLSPSARLTRVENQLRYLVNLDGKISDLNATVDDLRGQLEATNFKLSTLQANQKREEQKLAGVLKKQQDIKQQAASSKEASTNTAKKQYYAAYALIKQKKYQSATRAFQALLKADPNTLYRYSANYWLGELALIAGDAKKAKQYYQRVLTNTKAYRAKDAMLQLANIYLLEGNKTKAKQLLQKVMQQYKGTQAAKKAQSQLKKI